MSVAPPRAVRLAAAAIALGASLGACRPERAPTVAGASALPDSAEQVMFALRHQLTTAGVRRAQLRSDTAYFYDEGNRIELRKVRLVFFSAAGDSSSVLTGRAGRYDVRQQRVEGRGDVVVTSTDGKRLTSPHLVYDRVTNQITSDTVFNFTEPGRSLSGVGLRTDPQLRNVQVLGRLGGRTGVNGAGLARPARPSPAAAGVAPAVSAPPVTAPPVPAPPVPAPAPPAPAPVPR